MDIDGEMQMDIGSSSYPSCLSSFIDTGSLESHRYYLSRRTVLEMLRDRGYAIPDAEIELSLQGFRDYYGEDPDVSRLRISASHKDDPNQKIMVIFSGPGAVKVNTVREIGSDIMNKGALSRLMLIVQKQPTSQATKALELFPFKVEVFRITDLLVNITKHILKPKHQLLTPAEKQNLLEKYNVEEKQLPRMLQKDAIAQYYGLQKGQVVKITYSSEATETRVTYRCVW
ncbi:OLC1v1036556C1 [Oldenlandia corymbosa var. corymbosa]|uniref:OLC1v1036556C1 n=1 Tax=Oldenlandia corymbosa var. corymbosa TaxID=529605 RepID=A0AAV1CWX4_OLDCO|nr:OLC1v1036556C1 [Oldenlandia corymbosa var. corymbosa]